MDQVREFLQEMSLTFYADNFEEMGYDDLDYLLGMGPNELLQLQGLIKMRPGHFAKFKARIEEYQSMATPSTGSGSTPRTPMSSASVDPSQEDLGPMLPSGIPPSFGPALPMGPNFMLGLSGMLGPSGMLGLSGMLGPSGILGPNGRMLGPDEMPLTKVYTTWSEARLVSLEYSTKKGCSCMLDYNKSGGRRKVFLCRTAISKKRKRTPDERICDHKLLWTKSKQGDWKLNLAKSKLEHLPFCNSGQTITQFELVNDPKFVRSQHWGKLSTGKAAASLALGGDNGRLSGAVREHTARRARNTLKHYNETDYDEDWSKLNEWGHKFMEMNPECRFHLEKDSENRFVILCLGPIDR